MNLPTLLRERAELIARGRGGRVLADLNRRIREATLAVVIREKTCVTRVRRNQ
jgi:hypothetical protein